MRKLFLSILLCTFGIVMAMAVPAKVMRQEVQQPDSTTLVIYLRGDEHQHGYYTEDGIAVVKKGNGWYYAMVNAERIVASDVLAHNADVRSEAETTFCQGHKADIQTTARKIWEKKVSQNTLGSVSLSKGAGLSDSKPTTSFTGKKKGLVILAQYKDVSFKTNNPQTAFQRQFNEEGYSENNHIGSVHDYFLDQSYGVFDLTFDVVGPYTLSLKMSYYGQNDEDGDDKHDGQMIGEACQLADADVNYSDYDWDGDGYVDQVFVVYAGYGEASGADSATVWPHKSQLSLLKLYLNDGPGTLTLDGVKVDKYACGSELAGRYGSVMDGIGTACHEFSHCLGFPDVYDSSKSGGVGMGEWDLMDSGSYNGPDGNGEIPAGYSAYERWQAGWLEPVVLSKATVISNMPCIGDSARAYIIYNDNYKNEYFLLENRQTKRWFSCLAGVSAPSGLLIYHVDYDATAWGNNTVNNNPNHQRYSYVPADLNYLTTETGYKGDLFPGSKGVTAFADGTHSFADGNLFHPNTDGSVYLHKPVENICEENGMISFYFMGGVSIDAPTDLVVSNIKNGGCNVEWGSVPDVKSYTVELSALSDKTDPAKSLLLTEDFAAFKKVSTKSDGTKDLSSKLDSYTSVKGWSGLKVFSSPKGIKIGTSSVDGYIITPAVVSESDEITVKMSAAAYSTSMSVPVNPTVKVKVLDASGNSVVEETRFIGTSFSDYVVVLSGLTKGSSYKIDILPSNRTYIGDLSIYGDEYDASDFEGDFVGGKKVSDVNTVTGVTSTSYSFSGLTGQDYKVRVCAEKDKAKCEWTDYASLSFDGVTIGDCNGDGKVDANDARMIVNYYLGEHHQPMNLDAADMNGNGKATVADANAIVNKIQWK